MGVDKPERTANVPAINVVLTAPRPGISTPNLPSTFLIDVGLSIGMLIP